MILDWQTQGTSEYGYMHCNYNSVLPNEIRVWLNGAKVSLSKKEFVGLFMFLSEILLGEDE